MSPERVQTLRLNLQATAARDILGGDDEIERGIRLAFAEQSGGIQMASVMTGAVEGVISLGVENRRTGELGIKARPDEGVEALTELREEGRGFWLHLAVARVIKLKLFTPLKIVMLHGASANVCRTRWWVVCGDEVVDVEELRNAMAPAEKHAARDLSLHSLSIFYLPQDPRYGSSLHSLSDHVGLVHLLILRNVE
jgi:hypothetical protein